ncbi:MAG TPA: hypothetical protein VHW23_47870 [Kofleriaceae bacterium]|nr:hypothetical protein [Kofleriaceae bacterium]
MSNALERGELAVVRARGHAARCAGCQAFGHSLGALHDRLSREAGAAPRPAPAVRRTRPWLFAAPLVAGSAAVIALVIATGRPSEPAAPPVPSVQVTEALGQIRGLADRVSHAVTTSRTPLDTELDNLIHDGKRGLAAVLETGGLGGSL